MYVVGFGGCLLLPNVRTPEVLGHWRFVFDDWHDALWASDDWSQWPEDSWGDSWDEIEPNDAAEGPEEATTEWWWFWNWFIATLPFDPSMSALPVIKTQDFQSVRLFTCQ